MDTEGAQSRVVRLVKGLEVVSTSQAETIYRVLTETNTGPLELRFTEIALVELTGWLNSNPVFKGSYR